MDLKQYAGLIVGLFQNSHDLGYDTSYHALYWDWSKMDTDSFCYGDTRSSQPIANVKVDATPDVLEAYQTNLLIRHYNSVVATRLYETSQPNKTGLLCLISRGRTAKGTIVTIKKLYHNDPYNRMLVVDQNGTNYEVYAKNLDVLAYPIDFNNYIPLVRPKYSSTAIVLFGNSQAS